MNQVIKFVDLCAGLGGFHHATSLLRKSAGWENVQFECVLASELDPELRKIYVRNFPAIAHPYDEFFPAGRESELRTALETQGLENELALRSLDGALTGIHGDMRALVNANQSGLRLWPDSHPDSCDYVIPEHDLLFAGFPCQPFSKSGAQRGFAETRGTVFDLIRLVIKDRQPDLVLLENVGNFDRHDGGKTRRVVEKTLSQHYDVRMTRHKNEGGEGLLSPHHFGLPHHRERFYIIAQRRSSKKFAPIGRRSPFPSRASISREEARTLSETKLRSIVQHPGSGVPAQDEEVAISPDRVAAITHWNQLLALIAEAPSAPTRRADNMISSPIWGYELDPWHWYPATENPKLCSQSPDWASSQRKRQLEAARMRVAELSHDRVDLFDHPPRDDRSWLAPKRLGRTETLRWVDTWPGYAGKRDTWPDWKVRFVRDNREWALWLWSTLDPEDLRLWLDKLFREVPAPSNQKLEWNCKGEELNLWRHIIQFRPSGIRAKRFESVPALVAMTGTQIPIVPRFSGSPEEPKSSHLCVAEGRLLQGFRSDWHTPKSREKAFRALGNAVHCGMVELILGSWLCAGDSSEEHTSNTPDSLLLTG